MNTIEKILEYFKENEETFIDCIEELDAYDGYLGDDRYYNMEEIDEMYSDYPAMELLYRAFYGHDADNWHTDAHGQIHYAEFNPNRDYFKYNGYGNLVSTDSKDYSDYLDRYAVEKMLENRSDITAIDSDPDLSALFDELEQEEE